MSNEWLAPTVISSGIAGTVGLATHFTTLKVQSRKSRDDIRAAAFDQAKTFYTDLIKHQAEEIEGVRKDLVEAISRLKIAEDQIARTREENKKGRAAVRALVRKVYDRDVLLAELRGDDPPPVDFSYIEGDY